MSKILNIKIILFTVFIIILIPLAVKAESCSTVGEIQTKYTASGCSFTSEIRVCCPGNNQWTAWGSSLTTTCCTESLSAIYGCGNDKTGRYGIKYNLNCSCSNKIWVKGSYTITGCNIGGPTGATSDYQACESKSSSTPYICIAGTSYPGASVSRKCSGLKINSYGGRQMRLEGQSSNCYVQGEMADGSANSGWNTIYSCDNTSLKPL